MKQKRKTYTVAKRERSNINLFDLSTLGKRAEEKLLAWESGASPVGMYVLLVYLRV